MTNIESVTQHWRVTWEESGVTLSLGGYVSQAAAKKRYDSLVAEGMKNVQLFRVEEIVTKEMP